MSTTTKSNSSITRSTKPVIKSSPIKTTYLVLYNLSSALAWTYVLSLVFKHMIGQDGYTSLKEFVGVQASLETVNKRASTAFDQLSFNAPLLSLSYERTKLTLLEW